MRIVDTKTDKRNANPIFGVNKVRVTQRRRCDHGSSTHHAWTRRRLQNTIRCQRHATDQTDQSHTGTGPRHGNIRVLCQLGTLAEETTDYKSKTKHGPIQRSKGDRLLRTRPGHRHFRYLQQSRPTPGNRRRSRGYQRIEYMAHRTTRHTQKSSATIHRLTQHAAICQLQPLFKSYGPDQRSTRQKPDHPEYQTIVTDNTLIYDGV